MDKRQHPTPLTALAGANEHRLWTELARFDFDAWSTSHDRPSFGFAARLARDNGWSDAFARSVLDEYRRFIFLSQVLEHPVTPSDEVDQAWHLHLTYTRSYWDDLCGRVLGQPLHHGPTRGGEAENVKFEDCYTGTLDGYEQWFGHKPPPEVWPDSAIRFGESPHWVRVNTKRRIVINRPQLFAADRGRGRVGVMATGSMALAASAGLGGAGLGSAGVLGQDDGGSVDGRLIFLAVVFIAVTIALAIAGRGSKGGGGWSGCWGGCSGGCGGCGRG